MKRYLTELGFITHENIIITDWNRLEIFLLNSAETSVELDSDIKEFIFNNGGDNWQLRGDNDSLGFIVDVFDKSDLVNTCTFWFEDYQEFGCEEKELIGGDGCSQQCLICKKINTTNPTR